MALNFQIVKNNQLKLNEFIEEWQNKIKGRAFLQNLREDQQAIVKKLSDLRERATWFNHQNRLDLFRRHIETYVQSLKTPQVNGDNQRKLLYLFLVAVPKVLNSSLAYLEVHPETIEAGLPVILEFQKLIDTTLSKLMTRREKVFSLDLSNLRNHYEAAYVSKHGSGLFGFFFLPIKYLFRQDSREEELAFVEAIDFYLQNNGARLPAEEKEMLSVSALNLVRFKISMEEYGKGSQLKRLIELQLGEVGLLNNKEIITNFPEICAKIGVEMPEGLEDYFFDNLNAVSYS